MPFSIYFVAVVSHPSILLLGPGISYWHTGYVICNIDRAAAASSPHIISLTTMSPDRSSDRRIGRPTIEGYECSGKFYRVPSDYQYLNQYLDEQRTASPILESPTHLRCIANLEEPSPSIEDYYQSACCRRSRELTRHTNGCLCHLGSSCSYQSSMLLRARQLYGRSQGRYHKRRQARQQPQVHLGLAHHFCSPFAY